MFYDKDSSLNELLPENIRQIKDFQNLIHICDILTNDFKDDIKIFFDNRFVLTSDEKTLRKLEEMLNVFSDDTMDRALQIIAKMSSRPPNNINALKLLAHSVIQREINVITNEYNIYIIYNKLLDDKLKNRLYNEICKLIPANMVLKIDQELCTFLGLNGLGLTFLEFNNLALKWDYIEGMLI